MAASLFVIEHSTGPAWRAGTPYPAQPGIEGHMAFMRSLHDRGILVIGGPFTDAVGDRPVGMAIVRAETTEAAEALAAEDASVAAGLIRYHVRPWMVPMGTALEQLQPVRGRT